MVKPISQSIFLVKSLIGQIKYLSHQNDYSVASDSRLLCPIYITEFIIKGKVEESIIMKYERHIDFRKQETRKKHRLKNRYLCNQMQIIELNHVHNKYFFVFRQSEY